MRDRSPRRLLGGQWEGSWLGDTLSGLAASAQGDLLSLLRNTRLSWCNFRHVYVFADPGPRSPSLWPRWPPPQMCQHAPSWMLVAVISCPCVPATHLTGTEGSQLASSSPVLEVHPLGDTSSSCIRVCATVRPCSSVTDPGNSVPLGTPAPVVPSCGRNRHVVGEGPCWDSGPGDALLRDRPCPASSLTRFQSVPKPFARMNTLKRKL